MVITPILWILCSARHRAKCLHELGHLVLTVRWSLLTPLYRLGNWCIDWGGNVVMWSDYILLSIVLCSTVSPQIFFYGLCTKEYHCYKISSRLIGKLSSLGTICLLAARFLHVPHFCDTSQFVYSMSAFVSAIFMLFWRVLVHGGREKMSNWHG